jgi:hypothetical protein
VNLALPKLNEERKTFLKQSMSTTLMFGALMSDLSKMDHSQQLSQLLFILNSEMRRRGGARRSVAKRVHGRIGTLRTLLEWAKVEKTIRA